MANLARAARKDVGIVEMKLVSPPEARVRETEIVLTEAASKRLQIKGSGKIPPRSG